MSIDGVRGVPIISRSRGEPDRRLRRTVLFLSFPPLAVQVRKGGAVVGRRGPDHPRFPAVWTCVCVLVWGLKSLIFFPLSVCVFSSLSLSLSLSIYLSLSVSLSLFQSLSLSLSLPLSPLFLSLSDSLSIFLLRFLSFSRFSVDVCKSRPVLGGTIPIIWAFGRMDRD